MLIRLYKCTDLGKHFKDTHNIYDSVDKLWNILESYGKQKRFFYLKCGEIILD